MERLAFFIIVLALITAIIQKMLFRSGIVSCDLTDTITEHILVISIYDFGDDWEKSVRQIINTAVYKENLTIGVVIKCKRSHQKINIPIDLQHRIHVTYISNKNKNVVSASIEKMSGNEDYIAIFRNSLPYNNWDVNCLDFATSKNIITCPPSKDDTPTFPVIKNDRGILDSGTPKKMKSMSMSLTHSSCLCSNFIFGDSKLVRKIEFKNPLIEETIKLKKIKLKVMVPCFPIIRGKYIKSSSYYNTTNEYFKNMSVGLSRYPMDNECIMKYGSVEMANLQTEFGEK